MAPTVEDMLISNLQWAKAVTAQEPDFFEESYAGQRPQLLWFGCSDSRVPESVVMAARPGEIFTHRNIANQFHLHDDSAQSVLTYAVEALEVRNVAVVGHTNCGGAAACLNAARAAETEPPQPDSALTRWLTPMTELARRLSLDGVDAPTALTTLVEANVRAQVENIAKSETVMKAWSKGWPVVVRGWIYDLRTGQIRDLGVTVGPQQTAHETV